MKRTIMLGLLSFSVFTLKAQDGFPDPAFGTKGIVSLGVQYDAVAFGSDGRLVGVQKKTGGVAVSRYTLTGALDKTFGKSGGTVSTTVPFMTSMPADFEVLAAVQNNGKVVVHIIGSKTHGFTLIRYNSNGSLDATFGKGGILANQFVSDIFLIPSCHIAIQNDGKIITTNYHHVGIFGTSIRLSRFNNDGTLDPSFHIQEEGASEKNGVGTWINGSSFVLQHDGKIVMDLCISTHPSPKPADCFLKRYKSDGTPEDSYKSPTGINSKAVQKDDKLVVITSDGKLARLNVNGVFDPAFGNKGIITSSFSIASILLQADGKVIITGGTTGSLLVSRHMASGFLDAGFSNGGMTLIGLPGNNSDRATMTIAAGRLYVYRKGALAALVLKSSSLSL